MSQFTSHPADVVPRWLVVPLSAVIVLHLGAVAVRALAAPSGPWPIENGADMIMPPQFAFSTDNLTSPYLGVVKMTDNYHFVTNRPGMPAVKLEFRLKDADGKELAIVNLPDENANAWVRHRQAILASALGDDRPVNLPSISMVFPEGYQHPKEKYWSESPNEFRRLYLSEESVDELRKRRQQLIRPSEASLLFARSYARYLCREHGAEKVEVIRHHKDSIPAMVLFREDVQAGGFEEWVSHFGEFAK